MTDKRNRGTLLTEAFMTDENITSNIEWEQDTGIGKNTRTSRRLDVKKLLKAQAKERRNFKTTQVNPKTIAPNFKKLRTKIKDVYDDEEDDDETEIVFHFSMEDESSSLFDALKEDEKKDLLFNRTLKNQSMQQTAGKMEAVLMADKMTKQLGLKGLKKKIALDSLQDVTQSSQMFDKVLAKDISAKTDLDLNSLSAKDASLAVKGLKKMRQASLNTKESTENLAKGLKEKDLVAIGKSKNTKETAEMILEKSGRTETKGLSKKQKETKKQKIQTALRSPGKDINTRE